MSTTREEAARRYLGKAVSKAIESELLAVAHYRTIAAIAPSGEIRARALADAEEERRHAAALHRAAQRDQLESSAPSTWGPELFALHAAFEECVREADFTTCLFLQDVILEAAAISLYEGLSKTASRVGAFALAAILDKVIVPDERMHLADGLREICHIAPDPAVRRVAFERAAALVMPAVRAFADPPREEGCEQACGSCRDRCLKLDACDADEAIGGGWEPYVATLASAARSIGLAG